MMIRSSTRGSTPMACIPMGGRTRDGVTVLFDVDDTLIITQARFDEAIVLASRISSAATGMPSDELVARFGDIDRKAFLSRRRGYKKSRFSDSWVRTYKSVCRKGYDPSVVQAIVDATMAVWEPPYHTYRGAVGAVRAAAATPGIGSMYFLTLGVLDIQMSKLLSLSDRIRSEFSAAYVVGTKNADMLHLVLGDTDPGSVVMVGNSMRSDVEPALAVGMWAVHVGHNSWSLDNEHTADENHAMLVRAEGIRDVPQALASIVGRMEHRRA